MTRRFPYLSCGLTLALLSGVACSDDGSTGDSADSETSESDSDASASDSDSDSDSDSNSDSNSDSDSNSGDGDGDSTDSDSGDGDGDSTDSASGDGDGDGTDSASGDGDGDGTDSDSGDGDGDGTDSDSDSGDGDGDQMGLSVVMINNSRAIDREAKGGELTAECVLFQDGLPAADQPAFDYAVAPAEGVIDNGGSWSFEDFGSWTVSCEADVDNVLVSAEQDIAVLNGALDKRAIAVGEAVGSSYGAIVDVLIANEGEDQALVDAISALGSATEPLANAELELDQLSELLLPIPGGYPTANELDNGGVMANADDDAYAGALAASNAAFDDIAAFYASLDPAAEPTQEDLDALTAAGAEFDATLEAFAALEPSAHGVIANHEAVALSIRDHLVPALDAINGYVVARAQAEADMLFGIKPPGPDLNHKFGLLSLTMGMFNQSNIRIKLINQWYGDAMDAIDKSLNNLILNGLLDKYWPVHPEGPILDLVFASASQGFAVPGYDWVMHGSYFNDDPNYNLVLVFGDNWQGIVDNILGSCGVSPDNSAPENHEALEKCISDTQDAVDSILNTPIEIIKPGLLGDQDVHMGPFPNACDGFLPVATIIVPINLAVGRGESLLVNCLP